MYINEETVLIKQEIDQDFLLPSVAAQVQGHQKFVRNTNDTEEDFTTNFS